MDVQEFCNKYGITMFGGPTKHTAHMWMMVLEKPDGKIFDTYFYVGEGGKEPTLAEVLLKIAQEAHFAESDYEDFYENIEAFNLEKYFKPLSMKENIIGWIVNPKWKNIKNSIKEESYYLSCQMQLEKLKEFLGDNDTFMNFMFSIDWVKIQAESKR